MQSNVRLSSVFANLNLRYEVWKVIQMTRYIRFFFFVAISIPVAYLYTLPIGLALHGLVGNAPEIVMSDFENTTTHFVFTFCGTLILLCVLLSIHLCLRKDVYNRNRDATLLARKFVFSRLAGDGAMSEEEEKRFNDYRESGILTYNSNGVIRVSDRAVSDLWD